MFTDREKREYKRLFLVSLLFVLSSCAAKRHIQYVDRDVVKYEYISLHDTLINNVYDSVYVDTKQSGDTIFVTKYKYKYIYRDKISLKTDTCYKDSLVTKIEKKTVEKKIIPKWCYFSLVFSVICSIFAILKLRS